MEWNHSAAGEDVYRKQGAGRQVSFARSMKETSSNSALKGSAIAWT